MGRPVDYTPVPLGWQASPRGAVRHLVTRLPDGRGGGILRTPCGIDMPPTERLTPLQVRHLGTVCRRCDATTRPSRRSTP